MRAEFTIFIAQREAELEHSIVVGHASEQSLSQTHATARF
jgi:hypothetical protein